MKIAKEHPLFAYSIRLGMTLVLLTGLLSAKPAQPALAEYYAPAPAQPAPLEPAPRSAPLPSGADLPFQSISAGYNFNCGLLVGGFVSCWGGNDTSQSYNPYVLDVPYLPIGLTYTQVSALGFACALRSDGSLVCWGSESLDLTTIVPDLPDGLTFTQVSVGGTHACALRSDGSLVCWGNNDYGQTNVPVLPDGLTFTQVSVGGTHACALRSDGSLVCWGYNDYGQADVPSLPDGITYTQVSAGMWYTCALRSNGSLVCWGRNDFGQSNVPSLPGGVTYTQVSAGWFHTCALRSDSSLVCWGGNESDQTVFPSLPDGVNYIQVSTGRNQTCGLNSSGSLTCWEGISSGLEIFNYYYLESIDQPTGPAYTQISASWYQKCGLRSDGLVFCRSLYQHENLPGQIPPPALPEGMTYTQISAGYILTCGLRSNASLICWGNNDFGLTDIPTLPGGVTYTQVSSGGGHACALRSDGSIVCWGNNDEGQTDVPALPVGLTYTQVSANVFFTCALRSNGSIVCWGTTDPLLTNIPALPGGVTYTQVSVGIMHICGIRSNGSLICWGLGGYGETLVPALPAGVTYTQVSAGIWHTCAVRSNGSLACWGRWKDDNPTVNPTIVPVLPDGVTYVQVSVGYYQMCAIRSDGTHICWGEYEPYFDDLPGNGYSIDTTSPAVVSSLRTDPNPSGLASLHFAVEFSEFVVGVNAADFSLTSTGGVTGSEIASVSGSGRNYLITVNTGSGEGTLRLDVVNDGSIRDAGNRTLLGDYNAGEEYTLENSPPLVSIDSLNPNPTNAGTTISWHANDNGTFSLRVGAASCSTGTEIASGAYSSSPGQEDTLITTGLSEGENNLLLCLTNSRDNTGSDTASVTLDTTGPVITIANPEPAPSQSKTISASASDGTLTMSNTTSGICDESLVFVAYASQTFSSEADNGTRVCYRGEDALGNTSYKISDAITGIDTTSIEIILKGAFIGNPGSLKINNSESYPVHFTSIQVTFDSDAANPDGDDDEDDVSNPENYQLISTGPDNVFNSTGCGLLSSEDVRILTGPVTYDNSRGNGPFVATVTVNGGVPLENGSYRLYLCGSTSITDLAGNPLNGGNDVWIDFNITDPVLAEALPATGFAQGRITSLPRQNISYTASDLWLDIPRLGVKMDIVGVPLANGTWDVTWLGNSAGWLESSAFPTWAGNSALTGHVWNADNTSGPFRFINTLRYGDMVIVHAWGEDYIYEVRSVNYVTPGNTATMLKHEINPWLTLVTCSGYEPLTGDYKYRVLVKAVLVDVK